MKKIITVLILVLVVVLLGIRFLDYRRVDPAVEKEGVNRVIVSEVRRKKVVQTLHYTGTVKGINEVTVFPKVPGLVEEIFKNTGDKIEKGETILTIDRDEEALKYALSEVVSPIRGLVLEVLPEPKNQVNPARPVARVGNMDNVKIDFSVSPPDSTEIRTGDRITARFSVYPDKKFTGSITQIGAALNQRSGRIPVEAELKNPEHKLKSGLICDLRVAVEELQDVKSVSRSAVVSREGKKGIFIVDSENIVRWKTGVIELEGDNYIALNDKISEKELVVVEGNYGLIPDRKVNIIE